MGQGGRLTGSARVLLIAVFVLCSFERTATARPELSGRVEAETRWFPEGPAFDGQDSFFVSAAIEPELYWSDEKQNHIARMVVFYRQTSADDGNRTHGDIRELYYSISDSGWQVEVGINRVFWGVTESVHLVDIVTQTDNVESVNGEVKLGQPMMALGVEKNWGNLDMYLLPWFRERVFSSGDERFQFGNPVTGNLIAWDDDNTRWESGREERHVDFAVRWAQYFGSLDVGLSYFRGTNRDPIPIVSDDFSLASYYEQLGQAGLELQYLVGDWALKFEGTNKQLDSGDYNSIVTGFEYTFSDLGPWGEDIGILAEYLWNDRRDVNSRSFLASDNPLQGAGDLSLMIPAEFLSPFENDVFMGMRFALNDVNSTDFIAGVVCDLDSDTTVTMIEAGTRIGDSIRVTLNAYLFSTESEDSSFFFYRKDDVIEVKFNWYF
jgi:hypothetical protein